MSFTHLNDQGDANMVDITHKQATQREARAEGYVRMTAAALTQVMQQQLAKGDVLSVARIAGIQGAKRCADLIPLCHPLALSKVELLFECQPEHSRIRIESLCKVTGRTGVEMEALTAVNVAALTVFDMCKAIDPAMVIDGIRVLEKVGGKSGQWRHQQAQQQ
ncbi:cyclic pyranopterin monophosphate synthase MoaC [Alteromonas oceanisediminis]|uniref:cyclic pyranopterin monophosphate synthase MoaC n=1 Tax=Alteromonas oceanisediminis TaxID=2836180 RepID=UPI001BDA2FC9|nr:cyclic pyranopterin monophosphate synthase MoaC [Alteromonas oceanisediminis]MBT0587341.1 cyclic pyranopterin monophosphate synthase MoaC [Alteromonas oceanisediminis]